MMKKLVLMLVLVLGLTSLVQAGTLLPIELSVNGTYDGPGNNTDVTIATGGFLTIDVQAPLGLDWGGFVVIDGSFPGLGEWGDSQGVAAGYYLDSAYPKLRTDLGAGADSTVARYESQDWGYGYEIWDTAFSGTNPAGTVCELRFHCIAQGDVTISIYNETSPSPDYVTPDDRVTVHQTSVPEPATMALLGLGGLLLRRRK